MLHERFYMAKMAKWHQSMSGQKVILDKNAKIFQFVKGFRYDCTSPI